MPFKLASLWKAPEVNPVNHKARSIPALNPLNTYGRVFLLSWWGFFVAFWRYVFSKIFSSSMQTIELRLLECEYYPNISVERTMLIPFHH